MDLLLVALKAAPPLSEAFLTTVAGALRHAAERLKSEDG